MLRQMMVRALVNGTIFLFLQAMIWGLLSFFLPDGWWHILVNIPAFLLTLATAATIKSALAIMGVPGWLAFPGAIVLWFIVVLVARSIELEILESVF
jgi:hypothetical protein